MSELAAADTAGTRLGPDGVDAIGRGGQDLNGIGPCELLLDRGHARADELARRRVAHEDNAPALVAGDTRPTVGWLADGQLEHVTDTIARLGGSGTTALGRAAAGRTGAHEVSAEEVSARASPGW